MSETALHVCITGAAGQIAYSLLYSVAKGDVFGQNKPIVLYLLDIPPMMEALKGVVMEIDDCALPLLQKIVATSDAKEAFTNIDVAILVGAMPRKQGMERKDLLTANAKIFVQQGKVLNEVAKKTVKVLVVGNPANTNALITHTMAPSIPAKNFTCLTRLDQNRATSQIAAHLGKKINEVSNIIIWGNHSSTQYPDVNHGVVAGVPIRDAVKDDDYLNGDFIKTVQKRGGSIIAARKLSSAMSAAKAICDHMRDWYFGTPKDKWVSMGVVSDGSYGVPKGIVYSFPLTIDSNGEWSIVQGLSISDFSREKMDATAKELSEEKAAVEPFLKV